MTMAHNKIRTIAMVVVVACLPVFGACQETTDAPVAAPELQELGADLVYYGMESFLTAEGVREGRIRADTAYTYAEVGEVHMRGMELVLYEEDGRARATITAREGEMEDGSDRMVARGDVVLVVHSDGRKIETAELHYDPDRDRIWSDSTTVQTLPGGRVTQGTAFESDLDFTEVRIENPRGSIGAVGG